MNAERLLKLADFLDKLPAEKFNFATVVSEDGLPLQEALAKGAEWCGTTACAIGWTPAVFPDLVKWRYEGKRACGVHSREGSRYWKNVAEDLFDITNSQALYLFEPETSCLGRFVGPESVAKHIRSFVARGGV